MSPERRKRRLEAEARLILIHAAGTELPERIPPSFHLSGGFFFPPTLNDWQQETDARPSRASVPVLLISPMQHHFGVLLDAPPLVPLAPAPAPPPVAPVFDGTLTSYTAASTWWAAARCQSVASAGH